MIDPAIQLVIAAALAMLFAAAARHKIAAADRFRAQLAAYRLLPAVLVGPAARVMVAMEVAVAAALVPPFSRQLAGAAAVCLLLIYGSAIGVNLASGRSYIDCGCGDLPQVLSPWLLLRNGLLAVGALATVLPPALRTLVWADLGLALPALAVLVVTYLGTEQLLGNAAMLKKWRESS
jgi:hypothetical protein